MVVGNCPLLATHLSSGYRGPIGGPWVGSMAWHPLPLREAEQMDSQTMTDTCPTCTKLLDLIHKHFPRATIDYVVRDLEWRRDGPTVWKSHVNGGKQVFVLRYLKSDWVWSFNNKRSDEIFPTREAAMADVEEKKPWIKS